jgi:hypothetical protein
VIARLSEPAQLPAALVDQVLDASDEERAAAAGELLDRTGAFLEQSGAIKPSMSVLQLRHNPAGRSPRRHLRAGVALVGDPWLA